MKNKIISTMLSILAMILISAGSCTGSNNSNNISPDLNIRVQPGIEYCSPWCEHMEKLSKTDPEPELCTIYLEDITLQDDAGTMDCVQFCEYQMKNSIQLNPQCMVRVSRCYQVECASLLNEQECTNLDAKCR